MKQTTLLPRTGIAFLALLGATVILATVTIIVAALPIFAQGPEDILPAHKTAAVFFRPTETSLRRFEEWLPVLARQTVETPPQVLAIVDLPRGGQGTVTFLRRPAVPEPSLPSDPLVQEIGAFTVRVSAPELWPLLSESTGRLGRDKAFHALAQKKQAGTTWAFLAKRVVPVPVSTGDLLLEHFALAGAQAITVTATATGSTSVDIYAEQAVWDDVPAFTAQPPLADAFFRFSLPLPGKIYEQLLPLLPRTERTVVESLLLTETARIFGEEVSMHMDLLPLVAREGSFALKKTASGGTAFLLQGESGHSDPSAAISRLHDSVRAGFSTARIAQHILDKGRFISRNIRDDTSLIQETERRSGNWRIRTTVHAGDGQGLATAMSDATVLVSNDPALLTQALSAAGPSSASPATALGTILCSAPYTPALLRPSSPLLPEKAARIDWSLTRRGPVTTLRLTKKE
ncbi:MAG: hypothetical protein PHS73_03805 [Candidatus Peribacteraceae bacterium]|nr:hypothetical protein [Candidatus Peribacteraceae bacterium]